MFYKSVSAKIVADGLGWSLAADVAHRRQLPRVRREPTPIEKMALIIERFHPFGKKTQYRKNLNLRLEIHMEKASGMKKTNAAWSVDIFKLGNTFELFIVDKGSRQIIVRSPVELADASSVSNILGEAFRSFGVPTELETTAAKFFTSARFRDLMHTWGVDHIVAIGAREGLAERLAKRELRTLR
jgi:hypothetical protein